MTVTCNEDEGVDVDDHTAATEFCQQDATVNGANDDFSDAGRCVPPTLHANEHLAVRNTLRAVFR